MLRKLPRFFLLSFLSFCCFTVLFHVVAYAAELSNQPQPAVVTPLTAQQAQILPTPTIYVVKPFVKQQVLREQSVSPSPTPTIYIAMQQTTEVTPLPTTVPTTPHVYDSTEIPAVSPTALPTPTVTVDISPTTAPEPTEQVGAVDLDALFTQYSAQFGVSAAELEKIATCESGENTNSNTGVYAGMYQFLASTWESERGLMGLDPDPDLRMNPGEAIKTAAFMLSRGGENAWPNCH